MFNESVGGISGIFPTMKGKHTAVLMKHVLVRAIALFLSLLIILEAQFPTLCNWHGPLEREARPIMS